MAASRRDAILALTLLAGAAGCAPGTRGRRGQGSAAARLAAALDGADDAVHAAIARMDAFERRALRDEQAVAFAVGAPAGGGRAPAAFGAAGAAGAAGDVLDPGFVAIGLYADALAAAAAGRRFAPAPSGLPDPGALAARAAQALAAVRLPVRPATRDAGLAGIGALARLAAAQAGRRAAPAALAAEAQPHLAAAAALLQAVIGAAPGQGTRGAVGARRAALDAAHARLLAAARADRSVGPAGRYALYQALVAARDDDPAPEVLAEVADVLARLPAANAAVAAGAEDAAARVGALEEQVRQLAAAAAGAEDD